MKKHFSFFSMLCLLGFLSACNNSSNKDSVEKADSANAEKMDTGSNQSTTATIPVDKETADFMVKAADGGMAEVEMGRVASQKAVNARVKNFGQMMVDDHSKANDELKSLAGQKNVTIPSSMGEDHQKHLDDLNKKSGKDFDKAYVKMMVDDHKNDIDEFEKTSKNTKDADVKAWVDKTLPVLRKHLDSIQAINKSMR